MFMDLINEKKCHFVDYVEKYHGQPLIILGAGAGGKVIANYLTSHGIYGFHVCVDEAYWKPDSFFQIQPSEGTEHVFTGGGRYA